MEDTTEQEIKEKKRKINDLELDKTVKKKEFEKIGKEVTDLTRSIEKLKDEISDLERKKEGIQVSDHAVVRYLERVKGIDIDALKKQILDSCSFEEMKLLGSGRFPATDKEGNVFRVVFDKYTVVTVTNEKRQ